MTTYIDEAVSVDLVSSVDNKRVFPYVLGWRGRRYVVQTVGLHHKVRDGRVLVHVFSVTDGVQFFRLELNTETLFWRLTQIASDS